MQMVWLSIGTSELESALTVIQQHSSKSREPSQANGNARLVGQAGDAVHHVAVVAARNAVKE